MRVPDLTLLALYGVISLAAVYLTRATRLRVAGAFTGAVAAVALNVPMDVAAAAAGFWSYPEVTTPYGPPVYYVAAGLGWAVFALVAWRIARRFAGRGLLVLFVVWAVLAPLRDTAAGALTGAFALAPGALPTVVDALVWVTLGAVALLVMRPVAGPLKADALARARRQ